MPAAPPPGPPGPGWHGRPDPGYGGPGAWPPQPLPPLPPAPRRGRGGASGCLAAAVGLIAIGAVTVGLMVLVSAFAGEDAEFTAKPRPGGSYVNVDADTTCTFGFMAEDPEGRIGFLTAGHCGDVGDEVAVDTFMGPAVIGRFTESRDDGPYVRDLDLGFIALDDPSSADPAIIGPDRAPSSVAMPWDVLREGPELCFAGQMSGVACGERRGVEGGVWHPTDIAFGVTAIEGDSGSPVWTTGKDGGIAAVGILGSVGINVPDESYAELVEGAAAAQLGLRVITR